MINFSVEKDYKGVPAEAFISAGRSCRSEHTGYELCKLAMFMACGSTVPEAYCKRVLKQFRKQQKGVKKCLK